VALFVGRVRPDRLRRGKVAALDYEADRPMALRSLGELDTIARRRFSARRVVLWHRVGSVAVGRIAVIVGVATPHRASALVAARYLIDRLKRETPIWKMERARPARRPPPRRVRKGGR